MYRNQLENQKMAENHSNLKDTNNRIRYRLLSAGGLEAHFNVNAESGLITLARPLDAFAGEKITLRIEGADSGMPPLSSTTTILATGPCPGRERAFE
ncbi:hypothetical protein GCK72_015203 [Caenorhabditis remanei]|uniref:Cadherin domain-containing protein n=1 Tax=Caenorhabditis remanei TaxID=31234 RepID=A0A6A5GVV9_CAERE|nr:hypothetical protein GCK72_015201 [Caenorhabditis remanei]XP_053585466.1 hypothetical protein GCK72_015203 [Caenorhabditis remanei]KAF1758741.1 hypothetical protein GCK72_015201 [Caenorhabditis remanei]KAF1758743.1 hypothetical protein GCK72_015203 [Caenorhabditis remanei]